MPPPSIRDPKALTPGDEIGAYQIERSVGAGGQATLFAAYDGRNSKRVALKFPLDATDENIRRLRHEVAMGWEVHHPRICKSEKVETEDGVTFGVMEYVEGENLKSILRRHRGKPLEQRKAERLAAELCAGVSHMHGVELVHRDLKPDNIMMDDRGHVKIIDLGVAEFQDRGKDIFMGTIEYAAPEQLKGEACACSMDVFTIGILLYEVFTGHQWLKCDTTAPLAAQILMILQQQTMPPPRPSVVNTDLDFNIDDLIMPCLNIAPRMRPKAYELSVKWGALAQP